MTRPRTITQDTTPRSDFAIDAIQIGLCIAVVAILCLVAGGCESVNRAAGQALHSSYNAEIRPLAEQGLQSELDAGELSEQDADVIRDTFDAHQATIDSLRGVGQ